MNQQQQYEYILRALSLLIRKYGQRIDGGHEVYIPDTVLAVLSPLGQMELQRHSDKPGFCFRYFHNSTVEGKGTVADGGCIQPSQTDGQNPT